MAPEVSASGISSSNENRKTDPKVQQLVRQIPWGHNVVIINKIKNICKAEFYIKNSRIQCMMLLTILQQSAARICMEGV
ncbi:MAG: DUF1016 N-terminal domain-containing protein [Candidatus Aminicenantes bacterium]